MPKAPVLSVRDLCTEFASSHGSVRAVDHVSFDLEPGSTLGIVGESGCGKSATALSLLCAVPEPGKVTAGEVLLEGQDLLKLSERQIRGIRGSRISMIPQDPLTSLNPVMTIGAHLTEVLRIHGGLRGKDAIGRATELLQMVGIPSAATRLNNYPHQMSGGMRQRVMIAIAISCDPIVLIADEPTTALDVTVQAQILELLDDLKQQLGMAVILITHNLGVVAGHCDHVVVMYAGQIVEAAQAASLFANPQHPYSRGLLDSVPRLGRLPKSIFPSIPGAPPDLTALPAGCPFHPRCTRMTGHCISHRPQLNELYPLHRAACWHPVTGSPSASIQADPTLLVKSAGS